MIEISDPLPGSTTGIKTIHDLSLDEKQIGRVELWYLTKKDVKTFKRTKRKLKVGQPFGVQVFIEVSKGVKAKELGIDVLLDIEDVLLKNFKGLDERDISFIELDGERRNIIGHAVDLEC